MGFTEEMAEEITSLSNDFYELVPTNMNTKSNLPVISSTYDLTNKQKMLTDLIYAETVSKLIMASNYRSHEINPIDYCY